MNITDDFDKILWVSNRKEGRSVIFSPPRAGPVQGEGKCARGSKASAAGSVGLALEEGKGEAEAATWENFWSEYWPKRTREAERE